MIEKIIDKVVWHLKGIWYPLHAVGCYFHHKFRGHEVYFFDDPVPWWAHLGWICCHNCPDCQDCVEDEDGNRDIVFYGWYFWRTHRLLQKICRLLGHCEHEQWILVDRDENGNEVEKVSVDRFYCGRCAADL